MKFRYCSYAPHHVTAFFSPVCRDGDLLNAGSIGAGIVVEPGVTACTGVEGSLLTGTAERAVRILGYIGKLNVIESLPIGVGYASSAATALSASLAAASSMGLTVNNAFIASHIAEIESSTGLGDILAISCGIGIAVRSRPGAPGIGYADCFQLPGSVSVLSLEWGKMPTARLIKVLSGYFKEAEKSLKRLLDHMTFEVFVEEAERFSNITKSHGIVGDKLEVIRRIPGLIGFYTKKAVTIIFVEEDSISDSIEYLHNNRLIPRILEPSSSPPKLWVERSEDTENSSKI